MTWGKAEDAGGRAPTKDDNDVHTPFLPPNLCHFIRQLLYCHYTVNEKKAQASTSSIMGTNFHINGNPRFPLSEPGVSR